MSFSFIIIVIIISSVICCHLLTGSDTCTLCLAAPVAGARSVGPQPRAPGYIRDVGSVLVAGGHCILPGCPPSLFRSDQRLYRERVRLDTECARGPPLLCHFSRRERKKTASRACREQDKFKKKIKKNTDGPETGIQK